MAKKSRRSKNKQVKASNPIGDQWSFDSRNSNQDSANRYSPHAIDRGFSNLRETKFSIPANHLPGSSSSGRAAGKKYGSNRSLVSKVRSWFSPKNKSAVNHHAHIGTSFWSRNTMKSNKTLMSLASQFTSSTQGLSSYADRKVKKPVIFALVFSILAAAGYATYQIAQSESTHVAQNVSNMVGTNTASKNVEQVKSKSVDQNHNGKSRLFSLNDYEKSLKNYGAKGGKKSKVKHAVKHSKKKAHFAKTTQKSKKIAKNGSKKSMKKLVKAKAKKKGHKLASK